MAGNMGDYTSTLGMDASQFTSSTERAMKGADELKGSTASLTGQLERMKRALETAGRSTTDWIDADTKADAASKARAKSLHEEVAALQAKAAAERAAKQAAIESQQRATNVAKESESLAYRAKQADHELRKEMNRENDAQQKIDIAANEDRIAKEEAAQRKAQAAAESHQERVASQKQRNQNRGPADWRQFAGKHQDPFGLPTSGLSGPDADIDARATEEEKARFARERRDRMQEMQRQEIAPTDQADIMKGLAGEQQDEMLQRLAAETKAVDEQRKAYIALHEEQQRAKYAPPPPTMGAWTGHKDLTQAEQDAFHKQEVELRKKMKSLGATPQEQKQAVDELVKGQAAEIKDRQKSTATEAATKADKERAAIQKDLTRQLQQTTRAQDEQNLALLRHQNAPAAKIEAARAKLMEPELQRLRNAGASDDDLNTARKTMRDTQDAQHQLQKGGSNSGKWMGLEGARAIEDFFQGSANGGIKGGVLAASNNISQMGAAMGAYGGMIGAAISTTTILGLAAWEAWNNSQEGAKKAAEWVATYTEEINKAVSAQKALRQISQEMADAADPHKVKDAAAADAKAEEIDRNLKERKAELADQQKEKRRRETLIGVQGMSSAEVERAAKEAGQQEWNAWVAYFADKDSLAGDLLLYEETKNPLLHQQADRLKNSHEDARKPEFAANMKKEEEEIEKKDREILAIEKQRAAVQEHRNNLTLRELDLLDAEIDASNQLYAALKRGEVSAMLKDEDKRSPAQRLKDTLKSQVADENEKMQKMFRGSDWYQSRDMDLSKSQANRDRLNGGEMLSAQKDMMENRRRIAEARQLGSITGQQASDMEQREFKERDARMRQAKYGGLSADGSTGFSSMDVKSVGGFNNVLKMIRQDQQQKVIDQLITNGDISVEIKDYTKIIADNSALRPNAIVEFR